MRAALTSSLRLFLWVGVIKLITETVDRVCRRKYC